MLPALAVFVASGFAALVYQVVWQRTLVIFSGADIYSATIVVAAFMAGLGLGSFSGGHVADRLSRRGSLTLFAVAELAIAVFGFASNTLFYGVLYGRAGELGLGLAATAALLFVSLLWPTFFMGVSLPLLARGLTTALSRAASTVGSLYAGNTLGAAAGAFCATWWFVPQHGLDGAVRVAAIINLACAAAMIPLAWASAGSGDADVKAIPVVTAQARSRERDAQAPGLSFALWAALFALSGFVALSLEIIWFRLLGVMLKSTSYTFGTLLGLYLAGLGIGAAAGSRVARRVRRPALGFLSLQAAAAAYAALSLTLFVAGLDSWAGLSWFAAYFGRYEGLDVRAAVAHMTSDGGSLNTAAGWDALRLYLLLPAAIIGPPTVMTGFSFPLLQRVVQIDLGMVGRRVGLLVGANIAGSTLGAFVTGLVLLDRLGTAGTLKLLLVVGAVFAALGARQLGPTRPRRVVAALSGATALVVAVVAAAMPTAQALWAALHGTSIRRVIVAEDGSGLSLLKAEGDAGRFVMFVNGLGQSWIPYGGIHTILGALPAFIHPHPRSAAVIGLGSGDTLHAIAGRSELEQITSIEIVTPQLATLRAFTNQHRYPSLVNLLGDHRIEHVFGDGRLYLRQARRNYDIIEADALRPASAYAGNLYSDVYFALMRDHLNPGGLAVTWVPTPRVARTFLKVFPYVWQHGDIMMGSNAPIRVELDEVRAAISDQRVADYYFWSGVNIGELLDPYLDGRARVFDPSHDRSRLVDINTDLYPKDEFGVPEK